MVRAVDKADVYADAFQRSIISEAIYHFTIYRLIGGCKNSQWRLHCSW